MTDLEKKMNERLEEIHNKTIERINNLFDEDEKSIGRK